MGLVLGILCQVFRMEYLIEMKPFVAALNEVSHPKVGLYTISCVYNVFISLLVKDYLLWTVDKGR